MLQYQCRGRFRAAQRVPSIGWEPLGVLTAFSTATRGIAWRSAPAGHAIWWARRHFVVVVQARHPRERNPVIGPAGRTPRRKAGHHEGMEGTSFMPSWL